MNKTSALIAEIVWFVNTQLAAGGGFITLEEVLRLKMDDVSPETDRSPCRIRCKRVGFSGLSLISHYLPSDLWAQLGKQIEPGTFFVFSGKNGAPFLLNHIERHFKEAGRLAGFSQEIVPLCLRPSFDEQAVELSKKCARDRALMDPVSENEWDIFCRLIPSLIQRRGCKSAHDPLHLLNAIFYHSLELCPFRKLPPYFPPWRAVAAQYRRWKEHGILDEILRLREGIRAGQIDP